MKKTIISMILTLSMCLSLTVPAFAIEKTFGSEIDNYEKYTISFIGVCSVESYSTNSQSNSESNYDAARDYVQSLKLEQQGFGYIEESCLEQLDEYEAMENCTLNEYTVLVPKTRASTPTYYGERYGVTYYSTLTSQANITLEKGQTASQRLGQWSMNLVTLALTFSGVSELSIPWSFISLSLPSKYTVHTEDFMDSYINLNPINRAIYVKEGTTYKNVYNVEHGLVRPYFIYHYNDASSVTPAEIRAIPESEYPEADKDSVMMVAGYTYSHGGNPLYTQLKNVVDLAWD